ncbi:FAD/NAD-P-binding domain-containing protein [Amylostereum chailletii]|nr:FAD/NAD-P-binding domain-containing protein [Amylostereum chailletii]
MNSQEGRKNFQVAIVGGGICGLVFAIALAKAGVKVDIFEAASKYGEIGAGIGIGPNAVRALKKLGILDDVAAKSEDSPCVRPFQFRRAGRGHEVLYEYECQPEDVGFALHRAALLDGLAALIDPNIVPTHFKKRCVDITQSSTSPPRTIIHFADGSTHETDVVVGADGVKSTVRRFVIGPEASEKALVFTNTVAYRGLVGVETLKKAGMKAEMTPFPNSWMGDGRHIITFPIRDNTVLNIVAFVTDFSKPMQPVDPNSRQSWVEEVTQTELLDQYAGWGEDPLIMLKCIVRPSRWSVHGIYPPLNTYVKNNVVLLGDAAHGMLPHLGAGAGAGIEDAYILYRLLCHPQTTSSNLPDVLRAYDAVRVPRGAYIAQGSKAAGDLYEGHGPSGPQDEGRLADLQGLWEKVWHHDLDKEMDDCIHMLTTSGAYASAVVD